MDIQVVTRVEDFAALKDQWNDLLAGSASDNVFLTHEWLYTWWEAFGDGYELFILLCRNETDGRLVGIFPGYKKTTGGLVKARSVRLLGSEHVTSDFLECIVLQGLEEEVFQSFFTYLSQKRDLWDAIEITDVLERSVFAEFLGRQGILPAFARQDNDKLCPYLSLPSDWEEFLAGLSAHTRRNVRRYRNNLARTATIVAEEVKTREQLHEVMPDMIKLHQVRKQEVGFSSRFSSQNYKSFYTMVCERLLDAGRLILVFLNVDGKRVAFYSGFSFQGRVNIHQSGFDIDWSKFSVGSVLMGYLIEMAIKQGYKFVDFLRGNEQYKYHWTEHERRLLDFVTYNDSLRGNALKGYRQILADAKCRLKKMLPEKILNHVRKIVSSR